MIDAKSAFMDNNQDTINSFFKSNPKPPLRLKIKEVILHFLDQIEFDGKLFEEIEDKVSIAYRVAEFLQKNKIDGWSNMSYEHLRPKQYKMFKSVIDMVNYEIRQKVSPRKSNRH